MPKQSEVMSDLWELTRFREKQRTSQFLQMTRKLDSDLERWVNRYVFLEKMRETEESALDKSSLNTILKKGKHQCSFRNS